MRQILSAGQDQTDITLLLRLASMTPEKAGIRFLRNKGFASHESLRRHAPGCCWLTTRPYTSAPSKSERKLPQTRQPFRLKRWQRSVGTVVILGGAAYLVYRFSVNGHSRDPFIPYKLISKEPVSSTASIFMLEPHEISQDLTRYNEAWKKGIWNVHFKQPQLQIVRPYTPLPLRNGKSEAETGRLRFLIRNDIYGEVSSYLHRLPIGSQIELRGPNLEYEISPEVKQVVFFAGGTGIAPALQVAHALFGSKDNGKDKKLHILWASRKREDCVGGHSDYAPAEPLALKSKLTSIFSNPRPTNQEVTREDQGLIVKELEELKEKYSGKVTVEYFVNEENTWIDKDAVVKALSRFDDIDFSLGSSTPHEQRQILISGPPGFISYLAGPKEWSGGKEQQGGVSKILAHAIAMNPHNVKVWKI